MKTNDIKTTKDILTSCGLNKAISKYFLDAVRYCMDNKIHILDINMEGDVYHHLAYKSRVLTAKQIKQDMLEGLHKAKKETAPTVYQDLFDYKGYLTVKRLVILILMKLRGLIK